MHTRNEKAIAVVLSLITMAQQMPVSAAEPQSKLSQETCTLETFADQVQALTVADQSQDYFTELEYRTDEGQLYCDDTAVGTEYGALYVKDGTVMLRSTQKPTQGLPSTQTVTDTPLTETGESYGYTVTTEADGDLRIENDFQTARLIVKSASEIDPLGAISVADGYRNLHILQYADSAAAYAAYQVYETLETVEYVQPSHYVQLDPVPMESSLFDTDDDSYHTWGAKYIGTEDFINTYLDSEILPEVKVAVIDTGLNTKQSVFHNRTLEGGVNYSNSGDDTIEDDYGHGTHVSGTICELTPANVKILPIKVFSNEGGAADEQIYLGILYAIEKGADIINMSFGGLGVSPLEIEAMAIADEANVICVAAAGNNGDLAEYYYPGGISGCITVGAIDEQMNLAAFSNYGDSVDVVAPGVGIRSQVMGEDGTTESWNGTSMATPHVAACCALLRSYDKTISPKRTETLLCLNADDLGEPGFDETYAWGFLQMADFQWEDGRCMPPEFSEESGNFGKPITVAITTEPEQAEIYYTLDGSVPSRENGILYTGELTISETTWIRAKAYAAGYEESLDTMAVYTMKGKDVSNPYTVTDGVLTAYRGVLTEPIIPDDVTAIGAGAFADHPYIERITLPETVTQIDANAFAGCTALEMVYATGVTQVGTNAFADCIALESCTLAQTLTQIGTGSFSGCSALQSIALGGITQVPANAFHGCKALRAATLPDVTVFGENAFYDCISLKHIVCTWSDVTMIGHAAFSQCTAWEDAICLSGLTQLSSYAFSGCTSLKRVTLPEAITALPEYAFYGCSGLRVLQAPAVTQLGSYALATQSAQSERVIDLPYEKITVIGASAFAGFRIGNGYETISFDALTELSAQAFRGAIAGELVFPQLKILPSNGFTDAQIQILNLSNTEQLLANSVSGCRAVVLTHVCTEIAADAIADGVSVCAVDAISALDVLDVEWIAEPLVFQYSDTTIETAQFRPTSLQVLAGGVGLTYQWYTRDVNGIWSAIAKANSASYYPPVNTIGIRSYRCLITDASGMTEQVIFSLTVRAADAELMTPDTPVDIDTTDAQTWQFTPQTSGNYYLDVWGSSAVTGFIADAMGHPIASLSVNKDGSSHLAVPLTAGETYYVQTSALWQGYYAVTLTRQSRPVQSIQNANAHADDIMQITYGSTIAPTLQVTSSDGKPLTEGREFRTVLAVENNTVTVHLYGIHAYTGYCSTQFTICQSVTESKPVPVTLGSASDTVTYLFIPKETDFYYFYASPAKGYAEEYETAYSLGYYPNGSRHVTLMTTGIIRDTYGSHGKLIAQASYEGTATDYFDGKVKLYAGQRYYITCSAKSAAKYQLMVTRTRYSIWDTEITGNFIGIHNGSAIRPPITVTYKGETLVEGVDYLRYDFNNDIPGMATITILGMGKFTQKRTIEYKIAYQGFGSNGPTVALEESTMVSVGEQRIATVWFEAALGETEQEKRLYRIINEKLSGYAIYFDVFRYDAVTNSYTMMQPVGSLSDYELMNGRYCIVFHHYFSKASASSRITVVAPYDLSKAVVTLQDCIYTGDEVNPIVSVSVDGQELVYGRDYAVRYPGGNIMFGPMNINLIPTNRSYNFYSDIFNIVVDLPEDASLLETGSHSVQVTKTDRLAVYRVTQAKETEYLLSSLDVMDVVLRVFTADGTMITQCYGEGVQSVGFKAKANTDYYIMVKFNGTDREGTIQFALETDIRVLSDCDVVVKPAPYTGKEVIPPVSFYDGETLLIEGVDYRLRYTDDNVNIGTATANFIGMGKYFGLCDVQYQIVAPNLFELENFQAIPIFPEIEYDGLNETECDYLVYQYTPGFDTELELYLYEVYVRLTMQVYNADGEFIDCIPYMKGYDTLTRNLKANEPIYLLFSMTNISGWNQCFSLMMSEKTELKSRLVTVEGVTYRIFDSLLYAEVYALDGEQSVYPILPEIEGISVSNCPEAIFYHLPNTAIVYGYDGCSVAKYAERYGFVYINADATEGESCDFNGDGIVSIADAVLLHRACLEQTGITLPESVWNQMDLDANGQIDVLDVRILLTELVNMT